MQTGPLTAFAKISVRAGPIAALIIFRRKIGLATVRQSKREGPIRCYVTDPSGATMHGVEVRAINVETGVKQAVQTNNEGLYRILNLAPGLYRIVMEKHGFKMIIKPGVELHVQDIILRRLMEARLGKKGKREYVQTLRLLETFTLPEVARAIDDALRLGAISFDAVKHLLLCRIEQRPARLDLENYPHLPAAQVATTAAADYLTLLSQGVC